MKPVEQLTDDEFTQLVHRAVQALPDAPAAWQHRAIGLWPAGPGRVAGVVQALGAVIGAVLTFDSWATPGLAHGMRSLRSPTRHLLYSAQGRDIDLRITPADEAYAVSGQILGPDEAGRVELAATDGAGGVVGARHSGSLDAMGEFRIAPVPAGRYLLTLHLGDRPIVVQSLDVGEPAN
jgi:hypothetical protein